MALGGGFFLTQNKVLPGSYINFISLARADAALSDRGIAAMALELDWGADNEIFTVESGDFQKDSRKYFGYDYTSPKLKGLRDLFKNLKTGYFYRLNSGEKAENSFAKARYSGIRGNDFAIAIEKNVDDASKFDVITLLEDKEVDIQTVETAAQLLDNDFLIFKKDSTLAPTIKTALAGGTNEMDITGSCYQTFLDKLENYSFNTLGCLSTSKEIIDLYIQYTKRMRDEVGAKFQTVVYRTAADYEGIISVENAVTDEGEKESSLIYFMTGASASCAVNRSNTNKVYDGEFSVNAEFKQSQLEASIRAGKLLFHKVGNEIRILDDVNTFVSATVEKNKDFSSNQTIRILDQIGNDIAVLFNTKYIGKVQNNQSGRIAFWNDIVSYNHEMQRLGAIEDFQDKDVIVEKGSDKKSVVVTNAVMPVSCMTKLYMTVVVE